MVDDSGGSGGAIGTTATATAVAVMVAMPSFLTAASGVVLRADLGIDEAELGLAVSVFFAAAAVSSVGGGRWAERLGAGRALALATIVSAAVLLCIGLVVTTFSQLLALLIVGGILTGVAQPAANLALARGVRMRQGLMFGVNQSAIPLASLLAGASVPLLAVTYGWRSTFLAGAFVAASVVLLVPWDLSRPRRTVETRHIRAGDAGTSPLVMLAAATGVGTAAALTLPAFLIESAVANGIPVSTAGWLLAIASVGGISGRLCSGLYADRQRGSALYGVVAMLLVGAGGYVLLALAGGALYVLGAVIAYMFGWGWTGLLMLAVVRLNPNAPAAATGIVLAGGAGGAASGPVAFGFVVTRYSFQAAWLIAFAGSLLAAGMLVAARSWLVRDRDRRAPEGGERA